MYMQGIIDVLICLGVTMITVTVITTWIRVKKIIADDKMKSAIIDKIYLNSQYGKYPLDINSAYPKVFDQDD